ncbi:MAG: hypothetical protein COA58_07365 [Bacteroidetes bacterium]|nr:MAG: hypothetical protein COA58_07365 [Bacteroidota bacterium]
MRKIFLLLGTVALLLLNTKNVQAGHSVGLDISYRHIDSLKYEILISYYGQCAAYHPNVKLGCGTTSLSEISTFQKSEEIISVCSAINRSCSSSGGITEKFFVHYFTVEIDFASSKYAAFANCDSFLVSAQYTVTRPVVTTMMSSSLYVHVKFKHKPSSVNSAPIFNTINKSKFPCNKPLTLDFSASDTTDNDSISYAWAPSLHNGNASVTYNSGFSYNHPFTPYYTAGTSAPFSSPTSDPPIGIHLNPTTGIATFTPSNCTESGFAVVEVTEWRKDTNNVYQRLSVIQRDIYVQILSVNNNDPQISGNTHHSVCFGDSITLEIQSSDELINAPNPNPPDSVLLSWDQNISGSGFTIIDSSARLQEGVFTWKPDSTVLLNTPYFFTVKAQDNHCPINGFSSKTFSITVRDSVVTSIRKKQLSCNKVEYDNALDYACMNGFPIYQWEIFDTSNTLINSSKAHFENNGLNTTNFPSPRITVVEKGTYIIKYKLLSSTGDYEYTYYDTLYMEGLLQVRFDVDEAIACIGIPLEVKPAIYNSDSTTTFTWQGNGNSLSQDSNSFYVTYSSVGLDTFFSFVATNQQGCLSYDTLRVQSFNNVPAPLNEEYDFCMGDSALLSIPNHYHSVLWNTLDSTHDIYANLEGHFTVSYKDTFGCQYEDSLFVKQLNLPSSKIGDTVACGTVATLTIDSFPFIKWNTDERSQTIVATSSGEYSVFMIDSNQCENRDTFNLSFLPFNAPYLGADTAVCDKTFNLTPGVYDNYVWSTTDETSSLSVTTSGEYFVRVENSNGCFGYDTIYLDFLVNTKVPRISKSGSTLSSNRPGKHKWFRNSFVVFGEISNSITIDKVGEYTAVTIDENGCESDLSNTISKTLKTSEIDSDQISIYPNPSNGSATIQIQGLSGTYIKSIKLYDSQGKLLNTTVKIKGEQIYLKWSSNSEILFLELEMESSVYRKKIINIE